MLLNEDVSRLYGVHQEPVISQHERTDELNERLRTRHFSGIPGQLAGAQPVFASIDRPFSTKYTHWSLPDTAQKPHYSSAAATQVIAGMPSRVNVESELRNQYEALQKASQAVYVPSSTSNLYFRTPTSEPMAPKPDLMKYEGAQGNWQQSRWANKPDLLKFNNSTKTQMRQAI